MSSKFVSMILLLFLLLFMGGCTITLKGEEEVGFRQSTNWGFYHRTVHSEGEASTNFDVPALVELIIDEDSPE